MSRLQPLLLQMCIAIAVTIAPALAAEREPATEAAIAAGLAFIARQQVEDGSFSGGPLVATTSLAVMAMLSTGNAPDVGRYGLAIRRAVDFLIKSVADEERPMLDQALVTLALIEAYAVEPDPRQRGAIRSAVERACAAIIRAQQKEKPQLHAGGWGLEPSSTESDLHVTVWNVMALRAARQIGIEVSDAQFARAVEFINRCRQPGKYGFSGRPDGQVTLIATSAAMTALAVLDGSERPELSPVTQAAPTTREADNDLQYAMDFFATRLALLRGNPTWAAEWADQRDHLLSKRSPDGGWIESAGPQERGRVYCTSMAVLTLSTPMRITSLFTR